MKMNGNKNKILSIALDLFSSKGFDAVGVQTLCEKSGITKPTLYYHFGNKEGVLKEVLKANYEKLNDLLDKNAQIAAEIKRVSKINIAPNPEINAYLESVGTDPLNNGIKLAQLIRRPQVSYDGLAPFDSDRPELSAEVKEQVELQIKYDGYIKIQLEQVEAMRKLEKKTLPADIDYNDIKSLRLEAVEKLNKIKPVSVGQASRISGVNPADVGVLLVWLSSKNDHREE